MNLSGGEEGASVEWMGYVVSLFFLLGAYGLYAGALLAGGGAALVRRISWRQWLWTAGIAAAALLFVYATVRQNDFIYYWDYGSYWTRSYTVSDTMFSDPIRCVKDAYHSVNTSDYNQLLCLLTALPIRLIGKTFTRYVVICYSMYLLPAQLVFSLTLYKWWLRYEFRPLPFPALFAGVLLFPTFFSVTLRGFVDGGCLLPIALVTFLLADFDLGKCRVWRSLCLSGLVMLTVLFRRYFAFWAVGLAAGVAGVAVMGWFQVGRGKRRGYFLGLIKNALLIVAPALAVLLVLFRPFLRKALFSNFAVQYVGYDAAWATKLSGVVENYGYLILLLAVPVAIVAAVRCQKLRPAVCGLLLGGLVAAFTFFRVQDMDFQHYYILTSPLLLLTGLALGWLVTQIRVRWLVPGLCGVVWAANFCNVFIAPARPFLETPFLVQKEYDPMVRTDLDEIDAMVETLNGLTADTGSTKRIYVLSSSGVLNEDILQFSEKPDKAVAVPALNGTHHVDLRDGFPVAFFSADIIVVADPIQTHLAPGSQEVIRYLAEQMGDEATGLGRYFTQAYTFSLQKDVTACVLLRNSDYQKEDILAIQAHFDQLYGDFPALFHDRIAKYMEERF